MGGSIALARCTMWLHSRIRATDSLARGVRWADSTKYHAIPVKPGLSYPAQSDTCLAQLSEWLVVTEQLRAGPASPVMIFGWRPLVNRCFRGQRTGPCDNTYCWAVAP